MGEKSLRSRRKDRRDRLQTLKIRALEGKVAAGKDADAQAMEQAPLLARLSLTRPIFVTCLVLATLFLGLLSYTKIGVDLFPEIEIPVVTVVVPYRGAGPSEIETLVVRVVEEDLSTLGGIKRVFSSCEDGFGAVTCQFYSDTDMKVAEQQVRNRVQNLRGRLPKEADEPSILRISLSDLPVVEIGLEADMPPAQLYDLAKEELKNKFEQVPGVGKVDLVGGRRREIQVQLSRSALKEKALPAGLVVSRIAENSSNVPVGEITRGDQKVSFRTLGEYRDLGQIENAVVSFYDRPVRVKDLGKVVDAQEDARTLAYVNGRPSIIFKIYKQTGTNTIQVVDKALAQMKKLEAMVKDRPGSPKLTLLRDSALWIRQNVDDVRETIAIGILLVIVVVYFFLGNFRSTLITGLALPNSLLGAFVLMHMAGFTINLMTLLALSLSVGLLIDDAIVVRENIFKHIEAGMNPWRAALQGTREVSLAVIATSAVVIAVFLPVGFLGGTVGKFLGEFGLTMCFIMAISLFDALTIAPMLSAYFAGRAEHEKGGSGWSWPGGLAGAVGAGVVGLVMAHGHWKGLAYGVAVGGLFGGLAKRWVQPFERLQAVMEARYGKIILWVLDHRRATLAVTTAVFLLSLGSAATVTKTFIPASDSTEFGAWVELPEGSSLERTAEVARQADAIIRAHKEVFSTSVTVERNKATIFASLVTGSRRNVTSQELKTIVRSELKKELGFAKPSVGDIDVAGANEKPFTLVLKGDDLKLLAAYGEKLKGAIASKVKGLVDLDTNYREGKPEFQVKLDPLRAGRLGVSTVGAGLELRVLTDGAVAGKYRESGKEYDVRVRLKEEERDLEKAYGQTWVPNLNYRMVRLSSVSSAQKASGPTTITRRDRARSVILTANLGAGAGLGDVLDQAADVIRADPPPPGVSWEFVGQAEDFADLGKNMAIAIVLAIVIMYLILASLYESFVTPVTILLALPLAMAGAFFAFGLVEFLSNHGVFAALNKAHLFHVNRLDASINLFSMIGLILLLGLAAKNSILLVDFTLKAEREGVPRRDAIVAAGRSRLRPILMTSLALLFGTLPLALALNEAGRFRSSMGVGIAGGLISSTLLTLVVVPAAFGYVDDFRNWFEGLFRKLGKRA